MNNSDIVVKFLEQKWCHSPRHNIFSNGTSLWSYGWWEMARWVNGEVVVRTGKRFSPTTGKQMGLLGVDANLAPIEGIIWCYPFEETPKTQALINI